MSGNIMFALLFGYGIGWLVATFVWLLVGRQYDKEDHDLRS